MPDSDLLTIGAFARSCGLSASALRFYADAGVLVPALVDESTGYRYYAPAQAATARLIRHLRAVDMPLPTVAAVLAESDPARAWPLSTTTWPTWTATWTRSAPPRPRPAPPS